MIMANGTTLPRLCAYTVKYAVKEPQRAPQLSLDEKEQELKYSATAL